MALQLKSGQKADAGGSSTTPQATLPSAPTDGNLVVQVVVVNGGGAMTAANGYTQLDSTISTDRMAIFYKVASGEATNTNPCTITSAAWNCHVMEFENATTWAVDAHNAQVQNGSPKTSPSVTPTSGKEMIAVGACSGTAVAEAPWTGEAISGTNAGATTVAGDRGTNQCASVSMYCNVSSTSGSYSAAATPNATGNGTAHIAMFYDSAVASGAKNYYAGGIANGIARLRRGFPGYLSRLLGVRRAALQAV